MTAESKPQPMVLAIVKPTQPIKKRVGKGFSLGELREAGLTKQQARKLGLRVDKMRKTTHSENVSLLKKIVQPTKPSEEKPTKRKRRTAKSQQASQQ